MFTQSKIYVYQTLNIHLFVCIRNFNYSYNCMFTQKEMTQKPIKIFVNEIYSTPPKKIIAQTKLTFIISMTYGV